MMVATRPGRAIGRMIFKNVLNALLPSTRAASSSPVEMLLKYPYIIQVQNGILKEAYTTIRPIWVLFK